MFLVSLFFFSLSYLAHAFCFLRLVFNLNPHSSRGKWPIGQPHRCGHPSLSIMIKSRPHMSIRTDFQVDAHMDAHTHTKRTTDSTQKKTHTLIHCYGSTDTHTQRKAVSGQKEKRATRARSFAKWSRCQSKISPTRLNPAKHNWAPALSCFFGRAAALEEADDAARLEVNVHVVEACFLGFFFGSRWLWVVLWWG